MTLSQTLAKLRSRSIQTDTGCIVPTCAPRSRYVWICADGKRMAAHRAIATDGRGLDGGLVVRHKCDNSRCINPDHLEIGTQADNIRDRDERGRNGTLGENSPLHKLTAATVREIERAAKGCDMKRCEQIGAEYGVSGVTVYRIANHQTWKHLWI